MGGKGEAEGIIWGLVGPENWDRLAVWDSSENETWDRPPVRTLAVVKGR